MHDHVLNWKVTCALDFDRSSSVKFISQSSQVDMDVLGTENTFVKHKIVPVEVKYPWANKTRSTMHLERVRVQNEDDAKLVSSSVPQHYIQSDSDSRGRRMVPTCSWLRTATSMLISIH
jgi:hypothetical protein